MMRSRGSIRKIIVSTTMLSGAAFIFKGLYKLNDIKNGDWFEGNIEDRDRGFIMYNHDKTKPISQTNEMIDDITTKRRNEAMRNIADCGNASSDIMIGTTLISTALGALALKGVESYNDTSELPEIELLEENITNDYIE